MKRQFACMAVTLSLALVCGCARTEARATEVEQARQAQQSTVATGAGSAKQKAVKLGTPDLSWYIDGERAVVTWEDIPNASGYSVTYNGKEHHGMSSPISCDVPEGDTAILSVYAESDSAGFIAGDPADLSINNAGVAYENVDYLEAMLLSYPQLEQWAKTKGYKYTTETSDDGTVKVLRIIEKDKKNSGLKSRAGRAVVGFIDGLAKGGMEVRESITPQTIFSDGLENYLKYGNVKDMITGTLDGMKEDAKSTMKSSAVNSSISYALQDTDKHYDYYFRADRLSYACIYAVFTFEENHNRADVKEIQESWEAKSDSVYSTYFQPHHKEMLINIGEDRTNEQYPRYVIVAATQPMEGGR